MNSKLRLVILDIPILLLMSILPVQLCLERDALVVTRACTFLQLRVYVRKTMNCSREGE